MTTLYTVYDFETKSKFFGSLYDCLRYLSNHSQAEMKWEG